MVFIVDSVLIGIFAVLATALFRLTTRPAVPLGWFVMGYADIVLTSELAGTFFLLDNLWFHLGFHATLAAAAWFLWWRGGQPSLRGPWRRVQIERRAVWHAVRNYPVLWVLGGGVLVMYLVFAAVILVMPPNNWDSMTYHMARVGHWSQHASFYKWYTPILRQTAFPMNAELGIFWTTLVMGTDTFVEFVQWISVPVAMLAIVGLARLLGFSRPQSICAALLWATLPEIALQATTTQNDLVVSAFFASMCYLLLLGLKTGHRGALVLSGVAFGLGLGTKSTFFFTMPGLAVFLLLAWKQYGRRGFERLFLWGSVSLLAFVLLGAYIFTLNLIYYENPLGSEVLVDGHTRATTTRLRMFPENMARYGYQWLDLSGVPDRLAIPLQDAKADTADTLFQQAGISARSEFDPYTLGNSMLHEDFSWFGVLGFMVLLPVLGYQLVAGIIRKDNYRFGLSLLFWSFLLTVSVIQPWIPFQGRFFILPVTTAAPLLAIVYKRDSVLRRGITWGVTGVALITLLAVVIDNQTKPLRGEDAIQGKDTISRQAIDHSSKEPLLRMVDEQVPADATLGLVVNGDAWVYPFFGDGYQRRLVYLPVSALTTGDELAGNNIDFILASDIYLPDVLLPGLRVVDRVVDRVEHIERYTLLEVP
ncbi:MAG: glycosyltransferase family 39 protein [Anaerolineae bacterium]|nr:glycosyltransferase family 39 protein [Anaerolineae bacterium]